MERLIERTSTGALSEPAQTFVVDQINRLGPLEFVTIGFSNAPLIGLEIGRTETRQLEVRVPPRLPATPLTVPMRSKLLQAGFHSTDPVNPLEPWIREVTDAGAAIQQALMVLAEVFEVPIDDSVNLFHGSHRAEHEAAKRLDELRTRVGTHLTNILGREPPVDDEGDFVCAMDHMRIIVAPRVAPGTISLVRVMAVTNAGVTVNGELGLMLARLNFGLMYGRFALDVEHRAILFDETLLGDEVTAHQLQFTINVVAETARAWDTRLQHMFGGRTHKDFEEAERHAITKPGHAPSPYL